MMRCFVVIIAALVSVATSAEAGDDRRHPVNATPFWHAPCSVFSHEPCAPTTCSVFHHGPCVPEIFYPYGENLQLTIESDPPEHDAAKYVRPDHDLNTIADLFAALRACWTPPPAEEAHESMQISVRFSFKRSGALFGMPQITFATAGMPAGTREIYRSAIAASLKACTPLSFTAGLGGALAGRPILVRYVDNRKLSQPPAAP